MTYSEGKVGDYVKITKTERDYNPYKIGDVVLIKHKSGSIFECKKGKSFYNFTVSPNRCEPVVPVEKHYSIF